MAHEFLMAAVQNGPGPTIEEDPVSYEAVVATLAVAGAVVAVLRAAGKL